MRAARLAEQGAIRLDLQLDYERMRTLSIEARQKLTRVRPATVAQAASIPGISPADLQNLVMEVRRSEGQRSEGQRGRGQTG